MKYLYNYFRFLEEVENEDQPDKAEKQQANNLQKFIAEYPQKSKLMDDIYKKYPKDVDKDKRNAEIETLLGKEPRNTFLVQHGEVSKLTLLIQNLGNSKKSDEASIQQIQSDLPLITDDKIKVENVKKLELIKKNLAQKNLDLEKYKKEVIDKHNIIKKEMSDKKAEIEELEKKLKEEEKK